MLPRKYSIKKALAASDETYFLTQKKAKHYEDPLSVIRERQAAIKHVLKTGEPYLDIIRMYPNQKEFIELWESDQQKKN